MAISSEICVVARATGQHRSVALTNDAAILMLCMRNPSETGEGANEVSLRNRLIDG